MDFRTCSILLMLLICGPVQAQKGKISGVVQDNEGAVELASIALKNSPVGTVTDETGYFELIGVEPGDKELIISHVGYMKETRKISLKENESFELTIRLMPHLNQLDEMVITGTRTSKDPKLSAAAVSVLDGKTLENTQSLSLSEGLNFQPGLRVEVDCQTCNYTQLRINGLGGAYSQLLINNRPVFSSLMGLYGLEQISSNMIEKVEVIKGGGSALFGSSAVGGTVNIITREPDHDELSFSLQGAYIGAESPDINFNGSMTRVFDSGGISLFTSGRSRNDYDHNGDGFSEIPKTNNLNMGIKAYLSPGKYDKLNIDFFNIREYRRGGNKISEPAHHADQSEERDHTIYVGGLDYSISFPGIKSSLNTYLAGQYTDRKHYTGIDGVDAYGTTDNYSVNSGLQWNYYLPGNTLTAGLDYKTDYINDHIPYYDYLVNQTTHQTGIFMQSDWSLTDKLTLLSGLRADNHNFVDKITWNPRINILYSLIKDLKLRAGFSTGFRAPQAFDADLHIAFSGGGISYVRIDPALEEETSKSFNASITYDRPEQNYIYGFTLDGFYTRLENTFILEEADTDQQGNLILEKRNGAGSKVYGMTLEGRINYRYLVEVNASLTWQKSLNDQPVNWSGEVSGITEFLRTPRTYGFYTLQYNPSDYFHINFSGTITGSMKVPHFGGAPGVDGDRIEITPFFWDNNLKIIQDLSLNNGKERIEIFGGIQNMWNVYQDDFDTGKYRDSNYVYGPPKPRTFFMGISFNTL